MRLHTIQIIAALGAAIAFCLAFMSAGVALVSAAFMILGLLGLAWLARSLIRQLLRRDTRHPA